MSALRPVTAAGRRAPCVRPPVVALASLALLLLPASRAGATPAAPATPAGGARSAAAAASVQEADTIRPAADSAAAPAGAQRTDTAATALDGDRAGGGIPFWQRALRGLLGLSALLLVAWIFSRRRREVRWDLVGKGLGLQLIFALLVLKTDWGRAFFGVVNDMFVALIGYTNEGARFLFGSLVGGGLQAPGGGMIQVGAEFAFSVLPTIIFFSSLMTLFYHLGLMQAVVRGMAWLMQRTLRTSGAETVSAAGNIFVGQTEAPLLVKPFVERMTTSELNTIMTCGFATVAGGVMAAYVAMLSDSFANIAGHLLAATIMSAPAAIVVSKILWPETGEPETGGEISVEVEEEHANAIDAAAGGAADGLRLALNVGAMLLAFLALIAMANGVLGWAGGLVGVEGLTLEEIFGWAFSPLAWLLGVPWGDAAEIGSLLGVKMVANEFVAFQQLSEMLAGGGGLHTRSVIIATYALTGFANFSSIAIQIGGIGGIAPSRRSELSELGMRAMLGGTAATWMTATFAGVLA